MLSRLQPQKRFGVEALEMHVSDDHFLMQVERLKSWKRLDCFSIVGLFIVSRETAYSLTQPGEMNLAENLRVGHNSTIVLAETELLIELAHRNQRNSRMNYSEIQFEHSQYDARVPEHEQTCGGKPMDRKTK